MFTACIYTYVQITMVPTNFLQHILTRQPATKSASKWAIGRKRTSKSFNHEYRALIWFEDLSVMFTVSIASYD